MLILPETQKRDYNISDSITSLQDQALEELVSKLVRETDNFYNDKLSERLNKLLPSGWDLGELLAAERLDTIWHSKLGLESKFCISLDGKPILELGATLIKVSEVQDSHNLILKTYSKEL